MMGSCWVRALDMLVIEVLMFCFLVSPLIVGLACDLKDACLVDSRLGYRQTAGVRRFWVLEGKFLP